MGRQWLRLVTHFVKSIGIEDFTLIPVTNWKSACVDVSVECYYHGNIIYKRFVETKMQSMCRHKGEFAYFLITGIHVRDTKLSEILLVSEVLNVIATVHQETDSKHSACSCWTIAKGFGKNATYATDKQMMFHGHIWCAKQWISEQANATGLASSWALISIGKILPSNKINDFDHQMYNVINLIFYIWSAHEKLIQVTSFCERADRLPWVTRKSQGLKHN